jgi:Ca-activated chloride channel family protein
VAVEGTNPAGVNANTWEGIIAAGATPLGGTLNYVNDNFDIFFPKGIASTQQNFVILVTDGIETCSGNPVTAACNLYAHNPRVYTFVIGLAINTGTLDQIARCGSGGTRDASPAANEGELEAALNQILDAARLIGVLPASN